MIFEPFPKIPRWSRDIVITEKLDGSNALIQITKVTLGQGEEYQNGSILVPVDDATAWQLLAGSRNRWLEPSKEKDNFGFAQWVKTNAQELIKLGEGRHFGEWWGQGIQRGYGLKEKCFSLFNTGRWKAPYTAMRDGYENNFPKCCRVVPTIWEGLAVQDGEDMIYWAMNVLRINGSFAADFDKPEGIIIYHTGSRQLYKKTFEKDAEGKGE